MQFFCSRVPSCELQGYGATFPELQGGGSCALSLSTAFALRLGGTQEGRYTWTELALGALGQFTFFAQDSFSLKFPRILYKTYGWRFNAFFLTLAIFVDLGLQQKFKFTTVPIILGHH